MCILLLARWATNTLLLEKLRLPIYGEDDGAALRDILFSWWEETYLGVEAGAPRIGARR